jgi:hypothetical protein
VDLLGLGISLSHSWYQRAWSYDFNLYRSYFDPHIGNNHQTLLLAVAVGLLFWVLAGGLTMLWALMSTVNWAGKRSPF